MKIIIVIGKSPWKDNHTIRSFPGEEKRLSHCGSLFCMIREIKFWNHKGSSVPGK